MKHRINKKAKVMFRKAAQRFFSRLLPFINKKAVKTHKSSEKYDSHLVDDLPLTLSKGNLMDKHVHS